MRYLFLLFFFLGSPRFANTSIYMTGMDIKPSETNTQFIFYLTKKPTGNIKFIPPSHVIIQFENTIGKFKLQQMRLGNSNVVSISTENLPSNILQFNLEVKQKITWKIQFNTTNQINTMQLDLISEKMNDQRLPLQEKFSNNIRVRQIDTTKKVI